MDVRMTYDRKKPKIKKSDGLWQLSVTFYASPIVIQCFSFSSALNKLAQYYKGDIRFLTSTRPVAVSGYYITLSDSF